MRDVYVLDLSVVRFGYQINPMKYVKVLVQKSKVKEKMLCGVQTKRVIWETIKRT